MKHGIVLTWPVYLSVYLSLDRGKLHCPVANHLPRATEDGPRRQPSDNISRRVTSVEVKEVTRAKHQRMNNYDSIRVSPVLPLAHQ